ncbi:hypothetical protein [Hymenobacter metallicola]|uniref:Lipoprotein n=1 Tax=Hymenobacter metallicola TaxID=2563114 RepID=A0A4Z0Q174_9BACT|nr:hypothetical protein [Hymenobacter metallicola]TGE22851.1 hypothetical protein E5K02_21040 [Hymenobacter metallicola]
MKISTLLILGSIASLSLSACSKQNVEADSSFDTSSLIFGSFYGECIGEQCVDIYKLDTKANTLAEDTKDQRPGADTAYDGVYTARSQADYALAKDLIPQLPVELLLEKSTVIGSPDATDQGGFYVEVTQNGQRRFWLIDTNTQQLPTYLRPFATALDHVLGELR